MSEQGPAQRPWRLDLQLDPNDGAPRQVQLVRALIREIRRGRLQPGATLPGTRSFAAALGINRKAVVAAFEELCAQGWLESRPRSGTRVAAQLPRSRVLEAEMSTAEREPAGTRDLLLTTDGFPDPALAPLSELGRAYARALRGVGRRPPGYGDPRGDARLRALLAEFVNQARGLSCRPEQLLVSRGSQGALGLYAQARLQKGSAIAVESPGYVPAWRAFELAGAEVIPIPVDGHGLRVERLEALARRLGPRLHGVYVTPHRQYPTLAPLTPERQVALLELCRRHGLSIIEDDYDYEYHYEGPPRLPLAAAASTTVIYVASLSKLLAPSLRLGYVVAPVAEIDAMAAARAALEGDADPVLERAVAELLDEGILQSHARRARQVYQKRRDHLLACLRSHPSLERALAIECPGGGLAFWIRLRRGQLERYAARCRSLGVEIVPARGHPSLPAVEGFRLGFAAHDEAELTHIAAVLAESTEVL